MNIRRKIVSRVCVSLRDLWPHFAFVQSLLASEKKEFLGLKKTK